MTIFLIIYLSVFGALAIAAFVIFLLLCLKFSSLLKYIKSFNALELKDGTKMLITIPTVPPANDIKFKD